MDSEKYSVTAFKVFLEKLVSLNVVTDNTARNLRDSSLRLLTALTDTDELSDIREINLDGLATNYQITTEDDVTDKSVSTYKSRMKSAIEKFSAYNKGMLKPRKRSSKAFEVTSPETRQVDNETCDVKTFELPIPLRENLILRLTNLPQDLTKEEAYRISKIVDSYALTDAPHVDEI